MIASFVDIKLRRMRVDERVCAGILRCRIGCVSHASNDTSIVCPIELSHKAMARPHDSFIFVLLELIHLISSQSDIGFAS